MTGDVADEPSIWQRVRTGDLELLNDRELLQVGLVLALLVAAMLWVLFTYIEPPPPKRVVMTTGGETGAYFAWGTKYAQQFKKHGIALEVRPSKGSVENLERLAAPNSTVTIGLMQSGIADPERAPDLESLSSVAYEPIWVFYKPRSGSPRTTTLEPLRGQRIAIGPVGSGTRVVALKLLQTNNIDEHSATLSEETGSQAVQALASGSIDAAFMVAAADAPSIVQALSAGLEPVSFARADAYVRMLPWLSKLVLPRGVISLANDLPRDDITLVATSANLVVHKDLHPAIAFLLMDVAADVHKAPTIINGLREFPSEKSLDFPQSTESQRYFKNGRPFLQRYLPFWLANLLERLAITLLPALAIIVPLVQLLPKLFAWRGKARILRLYHEIEHLERQGALVATDRPGARAQLDRIEASLAKLTLGVDHYVDSYNLKGHLDMLRARLGAHQESSP
jgi:TRAP transporter TAXI family solute receptor